LASISASRTANGRVALAQDADRIHGDRAGLDGLFQRIQPGLHGFLFGLR